jgi:hypothetical protein
MSLFLFSVWFFRLVLFDTRVLGSFSVSLFFFRLILISVPTPTRCRSFFILFILYNPSHIPLLNHLNPQLRRPLHTRIHILL